MVQKKQYSSDEIELIIKMKKQYSGFSIRDLSKNTKIPKSVIGRWIKNPYESIQAAQVKEVRKRLSESSNSQRFGKKQRTNKEVKANLNKFYKKIKANQDRMSELRITWTDVDGFEVGY